MAFSILNSMLPSAKSLAILATILLVIGVICHALNKALPFLPIPLGLFSTLCYIVGFLLYIGSAYRYVEHFNGPNDMQTLLWNAQYSGDYKGKSYSASVFPRNINLFRLGNLSQDPDMAWKIRAIDDQTFRVVNAKLDDNEAMLTVRFNTLDSTMTIIPILNSGSPAEKTYTFRLSIKPTGKESFIVDDMVFEHKSLLGGVETVQVPTTLITSVKHTAAGKTTVIKTTENKETPVCICYDGIDLNGGQHFLTVKKNLQTVILDGKTFHRVSK